MARTFLRTGAAALLKKARKEHPIITKKNLDGQQVLIPPELHSGPGGIVKINGLKLPARLFANTLIGLKNEERIQLRKIAKKCARIAGLKKLKRSKGRKNSLKAIFEFEASALGREALAKSLEENPETRKQGARISKLREEAADLKAAANTIRKRLALERKKA